MANNYGVGWDETRTARALKLWGEGKSATEIARALGGVTRNGVIGKMHRLGVSNTRRALATQTANGRAGRIMPWRPPVDFRATPTPPGPAPRHVPPPEPLTATVGAVLDLGAHACRWPIGDPSKPGFGFCGRRKTDGKPYCAAHARVAYQPRKDTDKAADKDLARALRRYL